MKIRNILISIYIVAFVFVALIVIRLNQYENNLSINNEQTEAHITNEYSDIYLQEVAKIDISTNSNIATTSIYSYKDLNMNNNSNTNKAPEIDISDNDDIYYSQKNWLIEDVVVDTIKEDLSIFERLNAKKAEVREITKRVYKWLKDKNDKYSYVKNTFVLVPIYDGSEYAYKYYFDNNGYLIKDNISKDLTVIDGLGREIDSELKPIEYYIGNKLFGLGGINEETYNKKYDSKENVYISQKNQNVNSTPSQVIITKGVVFRKKLEQIYNTQIDNNLTNYIKSGYSYSSNVKATVYSNAKWKNALRLNGDNSYVVFDNFTNNFNRIYGKVSMGATYNNETDTICKVYVYDKDEYDKNNFSDYIVCIDNFNFTEPKFFSFTFDRSIRNIVFLLEITGKHRTKSVYFKDLKFGFNKNAYREELIRKSENDEEIDYLKSLGLYVEDDNLFDIIDDDGNLLVDEELLEDRELLSSYEDYEEYVTDLLDYSTGPDFDKVLKKKDVDNKIFGPYIDIIGTSSNIFSDSNKKKRQSKIIYTN